MESYLNVSLDINKKCNLNCRYCYIKQEDVSMSWDMAQKIVDYFTKLRAKEKILSVSTAEPLIDWPLLKKIIVYAKQKGVLRFAVGTNGTLFTKEIIDFFNKNNVHPQLSYDGFKKEHDDLRFFSKTKRTSIKLERTLNLLKDYLQVPLELRITYTPTTVNYLYQTVKHLVDKFKGKTFRINIVPVVYGTEWKSDDLVIFEDQLKNIADLVLENYRDGVILNIGYFECLPLQNHLLNMYIYLNSGKVSCNVGYKIISIDEQGRIWPCYWLGSTRFKEKEAACLGTIFDNKLNIENFKRIAFPRRNPFLSCKSWNYLINGDSNKPVKAYKSFYKVWVRVSKYVHSKLVSSKKFEDFLNRSTLSDKNSLKIRKIANKLFDSDTEIKCISEFSIKIRKGETEPSFRTVNFDNHSHFTQHTYLEKINLIKTIISSSDTFLNNIFLKITPYRLPIYIGLEGEGDKLGFKLYVNFSSIDNVNQLNEIARDILGNITLTHPERYFSLICLDIKEGHPIGYKIYYLYNKKNELSYLDDCNLSEKELKVLRILNEYNRNPYYVISERIINGKAISKKVEIGLVKELSNKSLLRRIFSVLYNSPKINENILLDNIINVIVIEKETLTFYFR